jgi:dTDP-4-amino-4,6-dideoxygalactose transaminase
VHTRDKWIAHLLKAGIHAVFHYLPLHNSEFHKALGRQQNLPCCERHSACLIRLPFYCEMSTEDQNRIIKEMSCFIEK